MGFVSREASSAEAPRAARASRPPPPAPALCGFLGPRPRAPAAALALRCCRFRAPSAQRSPLLGRRRRGANPTPRARLGGAGGAWASPGFAAGATAWLSPQSPRRRRQPAAVGGRPAPPLGGPALTPPLPMAPPLLGPSPRPAPTGPPRVGRGPPSPAGRFRAFQSFRNSPGRLLPPRTRIMDPRAAGSSRLGPLTHLVKIAPGTPLPASPRPDRLPGRTAAGRRSRPAGARAGAQRPGQGGPGKLWPRDWGPSEVGVG